MPTRTQPCRPPPRSVYAHSLGEVVNAAIAAGLRLDALHEHMDTDHDPRQNLLTRGADGRYRLEASGQRLPILFTLIATTPRLTTPAAARCRAWRKPVWVHHCGPPRGSAAHAKAEGRARCCFLVESRR